MLYQAILSANFQGMLHGLLCCRHSAGFDEAGLNCPQIDGSTESNMPTLQSGLSITMLGEQQNIQQLSEQLSWYTYGLPLVGNEILAQPEMWRSSSLFSGMGRGISAASMASWIKRSTSRIYPTFGEQHVKSSLDVEKSAGPCAVVLLGIQPEKSS